jgi:NAD(P)H-hydrate epimerase
MKNEGSFDSYFSFDKSALRMMPARKQRSNKGDFGRVLCVCGSSGMSGAAYLCAKAAYRTGAGLVEIFTHECNRIILQSSLPEAIVTTYTDDYDKNSLLCSLERADAVVVGCGLGVTPLSRSILSDILHALEGKEIPLVIDADAINLLARNRSLLKYVKGAVLTPHFMEASRLLERPIGELLPHTASVAHEIANKYGAICVMKDHETAVSDGGNRIYINKSGNSGMATGGSGDVLAGILGGLLSQNSKATPSLSPLEAVALSVYIHGLAGDAAAIKLGEYSLMASDIIDAIPSVLNFR